MSHRTGSALALAALSLALLPLPTSAQVCSVSQLTSNALDDRSPALSGDGTRIAFTSEADLTGGNPDGNRELLLWDEATGFTQLTDTTTPTLFGLHPESVDFDGDRIAFATDQDLTGDNADGNTELFLWEEGAGFTQLTTTTGTLTGNATISDDGTHIAFISRADLTGGNPDGNSEIFLWEEGGGFTQITSTTSGFTAWPSLSAGGTRIAFHSTEDLTGGNPDGSFEIFLWTEGVGVTQLTDAAGDSMFPSISGAGSRIAFESDADLTGANPDGSAEVFLWDEAAGFAQITDDHLLGSPQRPAIAADGTRIAFDSDAPNGTALWIEGQGISVAIPVGGARPTIDAAGERIAIGTGNDVLGTNPERDDELYLATCSLQVLEIPTSSFTGLAVLAALLAASGLAWLAWRG